jgi:nucleoside-triphosphatase
VFVALTGRPGVGKSTIFMKVVQELNSLGYRIYGFYCPEVRESGKRIGFKIIDLHSKEYGWLALDLLKARQMGYEIHGKRIGRYIVIESEAERIGVPALSKALDEKSILGIDEIGPMELSINRLRLEIIRALKDAVKSIVVVHRNLNDVEIADVLKRKGFELISITEANRGYIYREIVKKFI